MRACRVLALVGAAGLLAGCVGTSDGRGTGARETSSPSQPAAAGDTEPQPAVDSRIGAARRLAAQYNYTGAVRLLSEDASPAAQESLAAIEAAQSRATPWPDTTQVSHLFYHSLIVDPSRAFAKKEPQRVGYAQYMVTMHEFSAQLQQMYERGYVLVHPQRLLAKDGSGVMRPVMLSLPPGKKPLVLSVDDVSYYEYMDGGGFAANLTLKDGQVTNTYVDKDGRTHLGAYDVPTVIDEFVRQHPDFSYHGDKGTLALTGYNGILGYRSSARTYGDTPHTRSEQDKAKAVAAALKAEGWHFASHSWAHINMTTSSLSQIKADAERWNLEVRPLVGPTDELVYPFGADVSGATSYSVANPKFAFLHRTQGFDYFFPIDASQPAWSQLTDYAWRQARINVDGISMQRALDGMKTPLDNFFNTRSTIDPQRPLPVPR